MIFNNYLFIQAFNECGRSATTTDLINQIHAGNISIIIYI